MEVYFKPQHIDNLTLRMEVRANHIYILFVSLLNIISFKCIFDAIKKWSTYLEISFRMSLIASGIMALYAFRYNHHGDLTGRNETLTAVVLSLSAMAFFLTNMCIHYFSSKSQIQ